MPNVKKAAEKSLGQILSSKKLDMEESLKAMQNEMHGISWIKTSMDVLEDPAINWESAHKEHFKAVLKKKESELHPLDEDNLTKITLLKVGADVEEFLRDKQGNPVPVIGLIGGSKDSPMPILGRQGFALQEDNVALEYNIPPASTSYEFVYNLMRIREEIDRRVAEKGLVSVREASMRFKASQLQHPQAKTFGCDPDFCVWEQKVNEKPSLSPEAETLRTAGGHVHISFKVGKEAPKFPDHVAQIEALVMALDIYVGTPFVIMDRDMERRKLYGKAGAFRPKPEYGGLEYRVLSNHWTRSPELMGYVFDQVRDAIKTVNRKDHPRAYFLNYKQYVYEAINEGNTKSAQKLMSAFGISLPSEYR